MAGYNVPSYTTNNISIGPGVLFINSTAGSTPDTDVGAVRGGELTISREKLDIDQGFPAQSIVSYAIGEDVTLAITGIEWNFSNLAYALGGGTASATQFDFGGSPNFTEVSLKYQHRMAAGSTIDIDIWTANGSGELAIPFGDDVQEFNMTFTALNSTTDWGGTTLDDDKSLFQIRRVN